MTSGVRPHARVAAFVLATTLATSGLVAVSLTGGSGALADPAAAPTPNPVSITATGAFSGTIPDGVCSVTAVVLGAAGGSAMSTLSNPNGGGAQITATFPVNAGTAYSGSVGGGGGAPSGSGNTATPGNGGVNGGGTGGTSGSVSNVRHPGAGGGGYSELLLGTTRAILAAGGGGSAGGHSTTTQGVGGNGGLLTAAGFGSGTAGAAGFDEPAANTVGGGGGGTGAAGGAGGVNSGGGTAGTAGSSLAGGAGAPDLNPDAPGGGGGGVFGGGGGAATIGYNQLNGAAGVTGGGGGGGSSFLASTLNPTAISSTVGPRLGAATGAGANGAVTLTWNTCSYDLGVTKSVASATPTSGSTVTWTINVTNNGPAAMTRGDLVTLGDSLPGAGAKTITSISTSGGSNTSLASGAVTCSAAVGATMPSSLTCSRPYQPLSGAVSGARGLNVNETLTITYTQPITEATGTTLTNTATVTDRVGGANNTASASLTVAAIMPVDAVNDASLGNTPGSTVTVPAIGNDTGGALASTMVFVSGGGTTLTVPGQGDWSINTTTGAITFVPLSTFSGNPTPVTYRVANAAGSTDTAAVTVTYLPTAANDQNLNNAQGSTVTVPVLTNDSANVVASSVLFSNGTKSLTVTGQGTWTANATTGVVTFVPLSTFTANPTVQPYTANDGAGHTVTANIRVTYLPAAANDSSLNNALGSTVTIPVLANDSANVTPSSVLFSNGTKTLTVTGEGTWTANATTGVVTFVPLSTFTGNPTVQPYTANDGNGNPVTATITITYVPAAADDSSLNNAQGSTVTIPVLGNDSSSLLPSSVLFSNGTKTLTVTGQGTWTANPTTGAVTFVPLSTFTGNPTPIPYTANDGAGHTATATITVTYAPFAIDDSNLNNAQGSTVIVPVLTNDSANLVPSSVLFSNGTKSLTVTGQGTWTANATTGVVTFVPLSTFTGNPTVIPYTANDGAGHTVTATITVTYLPAAANDSSLNNALGSTVSIPVLANDSANVAPSSVLFSNGTKTLTVTGEGTWTADATTGVVTFVPLSTFTGNPTVQPYTANDGAGHPVTATITVTYLPAAANDQNLDNAQGSTVTIPVLANDSANLVPSSVLFSNGTKTLTVTGEGTWTANPTTGVVTFVPLSTFTGNPAVQPYTANDGAGHTVTANIRVTYLPAAVNDQDLDNTLGTAVTLSVTANDSANVVPGSVRFSNGTDTLVVPLQGTWTADGAGNVTFTPLPAFTGNPTVIPYTVNDGAGHTVTANITVTYLPAAVNDQDLDNAPGSTVTLSVTANDSGNVVASSVRFSNGTQTLVVPGQGTWTANATGDVTFTPLSTFTGNPTVQPYTVDDGNGHTVTASIRVTYLPTATNDQSLNNTPGSTVSLSAIGNDSANVVASSVRFSNGTQTLLVGGEGTWTANSAGSVTFTPLSTFTGNPTVQPYTVNDGNGNTVGATIRVTYLPTAADDEDLGNTPGSTVTLSVTANDSANVVPGSVRFSNGTQTLVVASQGTWTADSTGNVTFTPLSTFTGNPTVQTYSVNDGNGTTVFADITVTYLPTATDDEDLANTPGSTVTLSVTANDSTNVVPGSVLFSNGTKTLVVTGQGTWTADTAGNVTFTPLSTFTGNPTVQPYTVQDAAGNTVTADITVAYLPGADDDEDLGNTIGTSVTISVIGNDSANVVPGTVRFSNGGTTLVVAGQGTWTADTAGNVTFVPLSTFEGNPMVQPYTIDDGNGNTVTADITITYTPTASDDEDLDNPLGSPVTLDVLANDGGALDPATVRFTANGGTTLVVAGQGTWTVDTTTGAITFTPLSGFAGNPDPVEYAVDGNGTTVTADVTVAYRPVASNDSSTGNTPGTAVTVNVLGNDTGVFDPSTLRLIDPTSGARVLTLVVAGQGTWTVNSNGTVTFTPQAGFTGNPTPVGYEVANLSGVLSSALVTITYLPAAAPGVGGGLAFTGTDSVLAIWLALGLIALGLPAFVLGRRRRRGRHA